MRKTAIDFLCFLSSSCPHRRTAWKSMAISLMLIAPPLFASHEDFGLGARAAGMGEACTAASDAPGAVVYNPALIGAADTPRFEAGIRRAFQFPGGAADHEQMDGAFSAPVRGFPWPWRGAFGVHGRDDGIKNLSRDRQLGVTYATHGWRETDDGVIDWGVSLNSLSRSGRDLSGSVSKAGVDLGAVYRIRERFNVAASLINLNGPRTDIGGVPDRAPVMLRLGFAQVVRGFTMAVDAVKREPSGGRGPTHSLGAGMERWAYAGRFGAVALRSGVTLGDQAKTWSVGAGWRALGAELDYAALVPLASGSRWGHAFSLVMRFGSWDPEKEMEKLLGSETRYRRDLTRSLEAAEAKQWKLGEDLRRMRRELDDVQGELNKRTASEAETQGKYRAAREKIRDLEESERETQRQLDEIDKERKDVAAKAASKEYTFREDWRSYQKLKLEGAPDAVLLDRVKHILTQYKESGLDLGEANQELRRLLQSAERP